MVDDSSQVVGPVVPDEDDLHVSDASWLAPQTKHKLTQAKTLLVQCLSH